MKLDPSLLPLMDLLGKGSAIVLLAFAVQQMWRSASAAHRSLIWLAVFLVLALLPATSMLKPLWTVPLVASATTAPPAPAAELPPGLAVATPQAVSMPAVSWWAAITVRQWCGAIWAAGGLGLLGFRLLGGWQLRRLLRTSVPAQDTRLSAHLGWIVEEFGITRAVEIRQSFLAGVPLTWGWLKPVVLLPADAATWDDERLDAALRHELGHVLHHDACTRWLATLVCALWWPLPWVWLAAKRWRLEQEKACDDLVLRAGAPAEGYAMQLLQAARTLSPESSAAMAMARPSTLETRLRAVMDGQRNRRPMSGLGWLLSGAAALVIGSFCALTQLRAAEPAEPDDTFVFATKMIEAPKGTLKTLAAASGHAVISNEDWAAMWNKLSQSPGVDVLSSPSVTTSTRPGQRATIQVGNDVRVGPNDTETHFQGISITLLPQFAGKKLHLEAKVSVSEPSTTKDGRPLFIESKAVAEADLDEGKSLLIAGLASNKREREVFCIITPQRTTRATEPPPAKAKAASLILPSVVFAGATLEEAVDYFRIKARDLDPDKTGVNIVLVGKAPDARIGLDLKDVPLNEALRYTAELAGMTLSFRPDAAVIQKAGALLFENAGDSAAMARAKTLILPQVEFSEASVQECIEYFRVKSAALDPGHKGVNIILKPGANDPKAAITLSLKNVPLAEALRYVAGLASLTLTADDQALVLAPK